MYSMNLMSLEGTYIKQQKQERVTITIVGNVKTFEKKYNKKEATWESLIYFCFNIAKELHFETEQIGCTNFDDIFV